MYANDAVILHIIFKKSAHLSNYSAASNAAGAMQCILTKYFMLQVLSVKLKSSCIPNQSYVKDTTEWLASNSPNTVIEVSDEIWDRLKKDFSVGKDVFVLKDKETNEKETTLVFWPSKCSAFSRYFK